MAMLRRLIKDDGLRAVWIEGVTPADLETLQALKVVLDGETDDDMLRFGAAGRLFLAGELDTIFPLDDVETLAASKPIQGDDGMFVVFPDKAVGTRQRAIAKRLVEHGADAVILLGGSHDLGALLAELGNGSVEYERVGTERYRAMVE